MFGLVPRKPNNRELDSFGPFRWFGEDFFAPMMRDDLVPPLPPHIMNSFKVDVKDLGSSYEISAELPGMKKENIHLDYRDNYLTIAARTDVTEEKKDSAGNYIHRERRTGSVSRSFYVDDIDDSKISAEFKDGILKIDLPKIDKTTKKSSSIEIK